MEKHSYPLLGHVAEMYSEADLGNVLLLACQHFLEPQLVMFKHLIRLGLKPHNCILVGKNYSANAGVMQELKGLGCIVAPWTLDFDPHQAFDVWFEERMTAFTTEQLRGRSLREYSKVLVLDDGGFMHLVVHKLFGADTSNVFGIEQTMSGSRRIKEAGIKFECNHAGDGYHKLMYESPHIGKNVAECTASYLDACGVKNPNILIMGFGAVGAMVAGHLLLMKKFAGCITDNVINIHGRNKSNVGTPQLLLHGGKVLQIEQAWERIQEFDVIIGATGMHLIDKGHMPKLHPQVHLISSSSSDREFPAPMFRASEGSIHDRFMFGERSLANGGFPINFTGERNPMPPQHIEFTISLLMAYLFRAVMIGSQLGTPMSYVMMQVMEMWRPRIDADGWYDSHFKPLRFNTNRTA